MSSMITRWDPFRELNTITDRMNRLFQESFGQTGRSDEGLTPLQRNGSEKILLARIIHVQMLGKIPRRFARSERQYCDFDRREKSLLAVG